MKRKRRTEGADEPEPIRSPDTDVESFGPWLRRQREVRGIDQREVADASKISVRYIEALESNRFEVLPAEVFTKGFLRQYAVYVGLDPEEVVNYYLVALQARRAAEDPDPEQHPRPRSRSGTAWLWWVLLAAALVGAGAWWWLYGPSVGLSDEARPAATSSEADPAPVPRNGAPAGSSGSGAEPGADAAAPDVPLADAAPADATSVDTASGDVTSRDLTSRDLLQAPTPPVDSSPSEVPTDGSIVVVVDFSGDCWVEAAMDESRRLEQMRVQGESLRLEARSTIDLKLGNARVVQVEVNGMPLALRPTGNTSVVNLRIDSGTVAALRAARSGVNQERPQ